MDKRILLAVLFGCLLLSAPLVRSEDDDYEDGDEASAPAGDDEEKDVVVVTEKNFEEKVKKTKFALVGELSQHPITASTDSRMIQR